MSDEIPPPLGEDPTYPERDNAVTQPIRHPVTRRDLLAGGIGAAAAAALGYAVGRSEGENKTETGLDLPEVKANWVDAEVVDDELRVRIHVDSLPPGWEPLVYLTTPREHAPTIQRDLKNPIDGSWAILGWGIPDDNGNCQIVANLIQAGSPRGTIVLSFDIWSRDAEGKGKGGIFPTEQPDGPKTVIY